jgi:mannose-6-phosphate isomerase-like protein (cupin superfamily)
MKRQTMQSKNKTSTVSTAGQGKQLNALGHSITEMLGEKNTGGDYYVFECVSPPGQGFPLLRHQHEDKVVAIIEGEFSVMVGTKRFHALKGDVCFFPRQVSHSIQNIGTKAGTTLWTVVPGSGFEKFFNKLGKLPAGDPNPSTVAKIFADHGTSLLKPGNRV